MRVPSNRRGIAASKFIDVRHSSSEHLADSTTIGSNASVDRRAGNEIVSRSGKSEEAIANGLSALGKWRRTAIYAPAIGVIDGPRHRNEARARDERLGTRWMNAAERHRYFAM